jgi:hypothetical protein
MQREIVAALQHVTELLWAVVQPPLSRRQAFWREHVRVLDALAMADASAALLIAPDLHDRHVTVSPRDLLAERCSKLLQLATRVVVKNTRRVKEECAGVVGQSAAVLLSMMDVMDSLQPGRNSASANHSATSVDNKHEHTHARISRGWSNARDSNGLRAHGYHLDAAADAVAHALLLGLGSDVGMCTKVPSDVLAALLERLLSEIQRGQGMPVHLQLRRRLVQQLVKELAHRAHTAVGGEVYEPGNQQQRTGSRSYIAAVGGQARSSRPSAPQHPLPPGMSGTQPPLPPPPSISCLIDVAARLAGRDVRESRPSA